MSAPDRDIRVGTACRAVEAALRAHLCVTSIRIRLRMPDRDLEYELPNESDATVAGARGAKVTLMIRDALGIVGEIDVIDGCHRTCTGRAIHEMARIVEAHAASFRACLASETLPWAVAV